MENGLPEKKTCFCRIHCTCNAGEYNDLHDLATKLLAERDGEIESLRDKLDKISHYPECYEKALQELISLKNRGKAENIKEGRNGY